jgi:hypothetical protein
MIARARFVSESEAAEALGIPPSLFRDLVQTGRLPGPVPDIGLFDVKALDAACDRLSGLHGSGAPPVNPLDQWLETRSMKRDQGKLKGRSHHQ